MGLGLLNFISKVRKHIKLYRLRRNNIFIDPSASISSNAVIEIKGGGKITIGANTEILHGVLILTYGGEINIGKRCSINPYSILYGHGGLSIGDDVLIAGANMIIPNNHLFDDLTLPINRQGCKAQGVKIHDNVWIGHGCSILDGIEIESGVVIAAGSVVNKTIIANSVAGGVPAKIIKSRLGIIQPI
jgi:acetyltransferase-like isoleucine patch superfamily enzyme